MGTIFNFLGQVCIVILFLFEQLFNVYVSYNEQRDKIMGIIFPKWLLVVFTIISVLVFIAKFVEKRDKNR